MKNFKRHGVDQAHVYVTWREVVCSSIRINKRAKESASCHNESWEINAHSVAFIVVGRKKSVNKKKLYFSFISTIKNLIYFFKKKTKGYLKKKRVLRVHFFGNKYSFSISYLKKVV